MSSDQVFINTNIQSAINASGHGRDILLNLKPSIRTGKKNVLSDSESEMVVVPDGSKYFRDC